MKEKIILKSLDPKSYDDLVLECRVIPNDEIGDYLASISEDKKFWAYKSGAVEVRVGIPGEVIKTTLITVVDDKKYVLSEEEGVVKERTYQTNEGEVTKPDMVITNVSSTSNEQYIVKAQKFNQTYEPSLENDKLVYVPVYDSRLLTQVDEDVIIVTAWGAKAICLKGGYIVTYDAASNDYNTLEKGAYDLTYTQESQNAKVMN